MELDSRPQISPNRDARDDARCTSLQIAHHTPIASVRLRVPSRSHDLFARELSAAPALRHEILPAGVLIISEVEGVTLFVGQYSRV